MLRASLYITLCTAKNSLLVRLRRLREPRYLVFAIAGRGLHVFRRVHALRRRRAATGAAAAEPPDIFAGSVRALAPAAGGVAMLALAAVAWVLPTRSTLFDFSEAEIHLLFPAPVTRRALLIHRLVRSQFKTLFGAFVLAFFATNPGLTDAAGIGSNAARLLRVIAFWIVFVTFRVYFAGVTLARARLTSADARVRWTAWAPIVAIAAAVAIVGVPVGRSLLDPPLASLDDLVRAYRRGDRERVAAPGVVAVRDPGAGGVRRSPRSAPGGACRRADRVDRDRRVGSAQRRGVSRDDGRSAAGRPAARRRSRGRGRVRGRSTGRFDSSGSTEGVFFWKNGMEALRSTRVIAMLPFLVPLLVIGVARRDCRDVADRGERAGGRAVVRRARDRGDLHARRPAGQPERPARRSPPSRAAENLAGEGRGRHPRRVVVAGDFADRSASGSPSRVGRSSRRRRFPEYRSRRGCRSAARRFFWLPRSSWRS